MLAVDEFQGGPRGVEDQWPACSVPASVSYSAGPSTTGWPRRAPSGPVSCQLSGAATFERGRACSERDVHDPAERQPVTMSEPVPVRFATYQEAHSALSWPLLACGLLVPAAAGTAFVILGIVVNPLWLIAIPFLPFFVPFMISIGLLYRNWPTGIRIDESAISIGAVRSARAMRRTPTVNHQSWGLFTCPWPAVEGVRVVTDRAELRQVKRSPRYYTLTNRWANNSAISNHCHLRVARLFSAVCGYVYVKKRSA